MHEALPRNTERNEAKELSHLLYPCSCRHSQLDGSITSHPRYSGYPCSWGKVMSTFACPKPRVKMPEISVHSRFYWGSLMAQVISFKKESPLKWKIVICGHFSLATTNSKALPNVLALGDPDDSVCIWEILMTASAFPNTFEDSLGLKGDIDFKSYAAMSPVRESRRNCLHDTGSSLLSDP